MIPQAKWSYFGPDHLKLFSLYWNRSSQAKPTLLSLHLQVLLACVLQILTMKWSSMIGQYCLSLPKIPPEHPQSQQRNPLSSLQIQRLNLMGADLYQLSNTATESTSCSWISSLNWGAPQGVPGISWQIGLCTKDLPYRMSNYACISLHFFLRNILIYCIHVLSQKSNFISHFYFSYAVCKFQHTVHDCIQKKIKDKSPLSLKMPILATSLVTIKYPIMYLILCTIMQVSLPYCLVEVKIWFLSPGQATCKA